MGRMSAGRVNEMRNELFLAKRAAKNRPDLLDLSQVKGQTTPSESLS